MISNTILADEIKEELVLNKYLKQQKKKKKEGRFSFLYRAFRTSSRNSQVRAVEAISSFSRKLIAATFSPQSVVSVIRIFFIIIYLHESCKKISPDADITSASGTTVNAAVPPTIIAQWAISLFDSNKSSAMITGHP